jgi:hypothetical protein
LERIVGGNVIPVQEGNMFLGPVTSGIMLGLFGATMAWVGGHPMLAVLLVYSLIGSLGTLLVAMLSMHRALEQVQPRH